jgi:predicted phosphoribosyltransferase
LFEKYRYEDCAVLALSPGGVLVGEQVAAQLHCPLMMLLSERIDVPGENTTFGAVADGGSFTYNSEFSTGEIDAYTTEFRGYLDDKKREATSAMNKLLGDGGVVDVALLQDRTVILVSDGFYDLSVVDVALTFLKPIRTNKLVFVAPIATIPAVDKLHVAADELHILDVKENYMGTDHYYNDNSIPDTEAIVAKISQIVLNWR